MKIIKTIFAFIVVLGVAACVDAVMNFVTKDSSTLTIIFTNIGRFFIGWFLALEGIPYIKSKMTW